MDEHLAPLTDESLRDVAAMMSWSFGFQESDAEPWLRRAGFENVRVLTRSGTRCACVMLIPHAQFFGGRSVPSVGLAGVATPAESRGTGAAIAMLGATLRELRERGVATSNLYPAALPLYRRLGWETAGARYEHKVALANLPPPSRELGLRAMTPDDRVAVEACYRDQAARTNGFLDRGPYVWQRVFEPRGETPRGFVVGDGGRVEGYTVFYEKRGGPLEYALVATDLVARTPAAVSRLLTLFADHGTLGESVTWHGSPYDAFVYALPHARYATRVQYPWMVRMVDLEKAFAARGYALGAAGTLELEVEDDVFPENTGRFVLEVADGHATLTRGGRGTLQLGVRALAPLFTGYMSARALALAGALRAPADAIALADAIFVADPPSLVDFF